MATQSSIHFYLNWAKERIDEMDATLASLETKVSEVQADARVKANQILADLRKKRDDFRSTVKKQAVVGFEISSLAYASFKEFQNTLPVVWMHLLKVRVIPRIILARFEAN